MSATEPVEVDKQKQATEAAQRYELLLHSLTHQQTQVYIDRHVLLYEKWCRDCEDGLFIRDLKYIIPLLVTFRERFELNQQMFRKAFSSIMKLCSKPLLECKANERRSIMAMQNIAQFYKEIALFFSMGDSRLRAEVSKCLRCIVHGGKDPTVLRADQVEWVGDGSKLQLLDTQFIQTMMQNGGALEIIIAEFITSVDSFEISLEDYAAVQTTTVDDTEPGAKSKKGSASARARSSRKELDEDADFAKTARKEYAYVSEDSAGPSEDPNIKIQKIDEYQVQQLKLEVNSCRIVAQSLLDLCMDFAAFDLSASLMCGLQVCDGIIKFLGLGMDESKDGGSRMPIAIDLMWTVLDAYLTRGRAENRFDEYVASEVMDFEDAIAVLLDIFLQLLRDGYRMSDKECRNEVAIVLTLLINFPAASPYYIQSGVLMNFVTYACIAEVGKKAWSFFPRPLAKFRNFANSFDIDIQFKQILWMAISDILNFNDSEAILIVASSPLISTLMMYLEQDSLDAARSGSTLDAPHSPSRSIELERSSVVNTTRGGLGGTAATAPANDANPQTSESQFIAQLSLSQLRELQVQAIKFLSKNACKMVGEFLRIGGISRMLDITCRYYTSTQPEHKQLIYQSLLLLIRCVLGSNIVNQVLTNDNAIQTCLFLLEFSDEDATRALAARLTSILCSGPSQKICQEQMRNQDGIRCLVNAMNAYSLSRKPLVGRKAGVSALAKGEGNFEDPCEDFRNGDVPVLIVAVLDCIRSGIVGNHKSEICLSNEEGVDRLIELLEVSPFVLRTPVLRLMSDLLGNSLLMSVLQAWRSRKTLRSSAQILAHCWMDEEVRLDGVRQRGVLANLNDPLGNHCWPIDPRIPTLTNESLSGSNDDAGRSLTVNKLAAAIAQGRNVGLGSVPMAIRGQVLETDVRVILANIFDQIGVFCSSVEVPAAPVSPSTSALVEEGSNDFVDDRSAGSEYTQEPMITTTTESKLSPTDYQVLSMAQRYISLRKGTWWREVLEQLQQNGILPIEADSSLIQSQMEESFDDTMAAQLEQMELQAEELRMKQRIEKGFNDQIITQKHHQIKTEWLKRNRKNKATAAAHTKKAY